MKKIGHFSHRSASGRFIIKIHNQVKPPKLGSKVLTSDGSVVGLLIDVIGPVRNPYAVIKPLNSNVVLEPLEELYVRCSI
ncbi:MAG: Gar1/Naf1 family protein [Sulfolobales archaeon]|nr:Gar1/Naf1 family protein [Sulfolobales archaeon]MCX8185696.1 Gar1/Naf1 family protein [Sulfolobales archaeon]MDW7969639.1 Gar1/Naf1 family protein [Sulfolobales archaeon]